MAVVIHDGPRGAPKPDPAAETAHGLALFSVGLGLVEIFAAPSLARALGMRDLEPVLRSYGAREIANGVAILAMRQKAPGMWARVAGDAIDIATLRRGFDRPNPQRANLTLALAAVAGVTLLDAWCAMRLSTRRAPPGPNYIDRRGFPQAGAQMRGAARRDGFETPRDMRADLPRP